MVDMTNGNSQGFSLGVALDGAGWHPSAWREPGARPDELFSVAHWGDLAEQVEAAGLDYLTIDDTLTAPWTPPSSRAG